MLGLPLEKLYQFTHYKESIKAQTEALQENAWDANFAMVFGNIMLITAYINRHMVMSDALQLWEYGLDGFYLENEIFRHAYDHWTTEGEYAGLTFEAYLDKCGVSLADLRAARIVTRLSTTLQVGENTCVSNVDGSKVKPTKGKNIP